MIIPEHQPLESPEVHASWASRLLLLWYLPRMWRLPASSISEDTLLPLRSNVSTSVTRLKLEWEKEKKSKKPSFYTAVVRAFGRRLLILSLPMVLEMTLQIGSALLIRQFLRWLDDASADSTEGYLYALGLSLIAILLAIIRNYIWRSFKLLGGLVKTSCIEVLFGKTLSTSITEVGNSSSSKLVNLVSQNLDQLELMEQAVMIVYAPLFAIVCTGVLCWLLSWVGLVVTATTLLLLPVQRYLLRIMIVFIKRVMKRMDARVSFLTGAIDGMKLIKMQDWSSFVQSRTQALRRREERGYFGRYTAFGCAFNITTSGHALVLVVSLAIYAQVWEMNVPDIIGAWTIILSEHFYVNATLSFAMFLSSSFKVTFDRATQILLQQDRDDKREQTTSTDSVITASRLSATWKTSAEFTTLYSTRMDTGSLRKVPAKTLSTQREGSDASQLGTGRRRSSEDMTICSVYMCTFNITPGTLCMVVGPTGSGKTSLLMALLGELNIVEGSLSVSGSVAYVEQEPWLFAGTIRENIILGSPMQDQLYEDVITACALGEDFQQMPAGDQTVLGGKGANLSGGQKARIALARALYSQRDIYLLDDPLSAVDTAVAADLFNDAIVEFLEGKTVILVTHQTQFAAEADQVLVMNQGGVVFSGTYAEAVKDPFSVGVIDTRQRRGSDPAINRRGSIAYHLPVQLREKQSKQSAQPQEEPSLGKVPLALYKKLFQTAFNTTWVLVPLLCANVLFQVAYLAVPYWIVYWASQPWSDQRGEFFPCILFGIFAAGYFFGMGRARLLVQIIIRSSSKMHNAAVNALLSARSRFFDITPVGQILTLLTRDIMSIDVELMENLFELQEIGSMALGYLVIIVILNPYSLPSFFLSLILLILVLYKATPSSRELRKLDVKSKAPIVSQINTTIAGITSVRLYDFSSQMKGLLETFVRHNLRAFSHSTVQTSCALLYLNFSSVILIAVNCFLVARLKGELDSETIGIGLSFTTLILRMLSWSASKIMLCETLMTSLQRIERCCQIEPEEKVVGQSFDITRGELQFEDVHMSYSPELEEVLRGLSFTVKAGSKVGVVGRTGAGKSSLISVIFRLVPVQQGCVRIDGCDISTVNLKMLRKRLSVIPQQPFLFAGSIRENLDVFKEHTDEELWAALRGVQLEIYFQELPTGLDSNVTRGLSLSVGQRQLVCLARASLQGNKMLFMDEATANVDKGTDEAIQRNIRVKFADCTVVTIAHRIRTVIDNDYILVMEAGTCLEYDSPANLLSTPRSVFGELVTATGLEESAYLRSIAARASLR